MAEVNVWQPGSNDANVWQPGDGEAIDPVPIEAVWGEITGTLEDQTDLVSYIADLLLLKSSKRLTTVELTGDITLTEDDIDTIFYTLPSTSSNIVIAVPAGLGAGFHMSVVHHGTGSVTFVGLDATVTPQDGGTLVLPKDGRASLVGSGPSDLYALVGVVVAA